MVVIQGYLKGEEPSTAREEITLELRRTPSRPMVQDYAEMRRAPCLAKLTSLTKEITSGKAREERAPNKTD